jgi:hypothetical protein
VSVTRDQFAEVLGNGLAAAGAPEEGGTSGAPVRLPAVGDQTADVSTTITVASDASSTPVTLSPLPTTTNDNEPVADEPASNVSGNEPDEAPDQTIAAESSAPEPNSQPQPANDNSPSETLPASGTD